LASSYCQSCSLLLSSFTTAGLASMDLDGVTAEPSKEKKTSKDAAITFYPASATLPILPTTDRFPLLPVASSSSSPGKATTVTGSSRAELMMNKASGRDRQATTTSSSFLSSSTATTTTSQADPDGSSWQFNIKRRLDLSGSSQSSSAAAAASDPSQQQSYFQPVSSFLRKNIMEGVIKKGIGRERG